MTVLHSFPTLCLLTALFVPIASGTASAQADVVREPALVARCLCLAPIVEKRRAESELARARFERLQAELKSEDEALEYERTRIDGANEAELDSYRRRLAEAQETRARLENDFFPAAERATLRHAQVYGEYTPMCTRRPIDADTLARVRRNLVCPPE